MTLKSPTLTVALCFLCVWKVNNDYMTVPDVIRIDSPYFRVVKDWLELWAEPRTVEALIQVSYLVLLDNDFRVYEVVLPGTVISENENKQKSARLWSCNGPSTQQR